MASLTQTTRFKRKLKKKKMGKVNKRLRKNHGTTPAFDIHTAEADKNAPNEAKQSK